MASRSTLMRIAVMSLGSLFIGLGIIGLFLPILQGVLFILVGLYILSRESVIAHRLLVRLRERYPGLDRQLERARDRVRRIFRRDGDGDEDGEGRTRPWPGAGPGRRDGPDA